MTVSELIEELSKYDPELTVKISSTEYIGDELDIHEIDTNREDGGPLII